jgi:hypothetical protein
LFNSELPFGKRDVSDPGNWRASDAEVFRLLHEADPDLRHLVTIPGILTEAHRCCRDPDIFRDEVAMRRSPDRIGNVQR